MKILYFSDFLIQYEENQILGGGIYGKFYIAHVKKKNIWSIFQEKEIIIKICKEDNEFIFRKNERDYDFIKKSDFDIQNISFICPKISMEFNKAFTSDMWPCLQYIPPEYILDKIPDDKDKVFKANLWEFGITCYKCLTGQLPFGNNVNNIHTIFDEILNKAIVWPHNVDEKMKEFVENLLKKSPEERNLISLLLDS